MKRNGKSERERLGEARENALRAMKDAGFDVGDAVKVTVDPELPFMGYTRPQGKGFQVVVSGMAVESGMLEGLLIHEMSHIYRMQTRHPSHDAGIITEVIERLGKPSLSVDYRQKILHDLVNHIEDLYADDISVSIMRGRGYMSRERLSAFLQDWVKDTPISSEDAIRDAWVNASILVNNARALGQMDRHHIEDIGGKAATANRRFLAALPPSASRDFERYRRVLAHLPTDLTEAEYRTMLTDYLERFEKLVETLASDSTVLHGDVAGDASFRREVDEWASEPPMHGGD